jgi:hypothetical protein
MDDQISRQAAIDALRDKFKRTPTNAIRAMDAVKQLPPAEPERKKGKWIVDALANNIWHCSECGTDAPVEPTGGTEYKSNYCPCCGFDMRGEENETD